jgi:cyclic pyranopterin phosphate synthase
MQLLSINTSEKKGRQKRPVEQAEFRVDHGIVGDAHAEGGIRQVSLLAKESHEAYQPKTDVKLKDGIFGENLTTRGIDLLKLKIGDQLHMDKVTLEISKIGKECHTPCAISARVGECIMPKECVFAIVKTGGVLRPGTPIVKASQ